MSTPIANLVTPNTAALLEAIASKLGVRFQPQGEVGFGRSCVGFLSRAGGYVEFDPLIGDEYKPLWGYDDRLKAPEGVAAYHKHDCLVVLAPDEDYEKAAQGLLAWMHHLKAQGDVEVVEYDKGLNGDRARIALAIGASTKGYAIRFKGGA